MTINELKVPNLITQQNAIKFLTNENIKAIEIRYSLNVKFRSFCRHLEYAYYAGFVKNNNTEIGNLTHDRDAEDLF